MVRGRESGEGWLGLREEKGVVRMDMYGMNYMYTQISVQ